MNNDPQMIIYLIARIREKANRFIATELAKRNMAGLKPVHGDVLFILHTHGSMSMKEIAERVDRKKSTVTTLVDKLVNEGFAEKNVDETDNRYFIISLTEKGRNLKNDLIEISDQLISTVYKDMPVEERQQLVNCLYTINESW